MKSITPFEIFWRFLSLGCISFGGPAAHIGYFQSAFVQRLKWLDDDAYARLVSLSQFLPGPGSSQIGFAIGLSQAGLLGGIAAFIGFTLPSFLLLTLLSVSAPQHILGETYFGLVDGLKLLAVVVVADATLNMFNAFCQRTGTTLIAVAVAVAIVVLPSVWTQIFALSLAALIGTYNPPTDLPENTIKTKEKKRANYSALLLFGILFAGLPLLALHSNWLELFNDFFRAGSLVFGGGHVVLPLLQNTVGDSLSTDQFLSGYAAAQAVPGPMFTIASYLGSELTPNARLLGALLATIAVFLPGFLLVIALQDSWEHLAGKPRVAGAMRGINAAVVGLLFAALCTPVFSSAVHGPLDLALVILGFASLRLFKVPILLVVIAFVTIGIAVGHFA